MPGLLLETGEQRAAVVEQAQGERPARVGGDVLPTESKVADHLVDAVHAEGGEMVSQGAEVALGEGEQALVHEALDGLAFDLQAGAAEFEQLLDAAE